MQSISRDLSRTPASKRPSFVINSLSWIERFVFVKRSFRTREFPCSSRRLPRFVIMSLAGAALAAPAGGVIMCLGVSFADDAGRGA